MLENKCNTCYIEALCKVRTKGCCHKTTTYHCIDYMNKEEFKNIIEESRNKKDNTLNHIVLSNSILDYFYEFGTWKGHAIIKDLFKIIDPMKKKIRG